MTMTSPLLQSAIDSLWGPGLPYQFQRESAEFLLHAGYGISADEMGLGKTLEGILVILAGFAEGPSKALVVCPNSLKINWVRELETWAPHLRVVWSRDGKKLPKSFGEYDVAIINYEQFKYSAGLFSEAHTIVADEAHYLVNLWSGRTDIFHHHIARVRPKRLVLLTGTPIKNRTQELYSLLVLCSMRPDAPPGYDVRGEFPTVLQFMETFCHKRPIFERGRKGFEYYGLKNRERLDRLLDGKVIRHAEKDCSDLPPSTRTVHEVELPDVDSIFDAELKTAWEDFQANRRTQFLAAKKAACAVYKVPATVERAEALLAAGMGPLVIFSDHVDSAKLLSAALAKKYTVGLIHGEVDLKFRQAWIDGFQSGKVDVLVATIPALKEGVTLTRSNRLIYNDLPWEPASLEQSAKRIHRIGQTRPCFVDIIALTGMDAMIARVLAKKMNVIDKILSPLEEDTRNAKPRNFTARS